MPYVSAAQRGWAHTKEGTKALGGPAKVAEWDRASKGKSLPRHVNSFAEGGSMPMPTAPMRTTPTLPSQANPRAVAATTKPMPSQAFGGGRPAAPAGGGTAPTGVMPTNTFASPGVGKASTPGVASFAEGGPVLGRTTDFLKTPDRFRQDGSGKFASPKPEPTEDVWGKGSSTANPKGRDKSLKAVKPKS